MKHLGKTLLVLMIMSLIMLSCTEEKIEAKSMEQIYAEEGVPVKVETVKQSQFNSKRIYQAALTGIQESSAYASFGDRIDKILVDVGDYVKKDQVVVTFPKDAPSAQYYQAKTAFKNAKKSLERIKKLNQKGGISNQDLDNVQAQYDVAEANWQAVSKSVEVKAPISGMVTRIGVSESDNVDKEAELLTVANTKQLKAKIWVSENEIGDFTPGLEAKALWKNRTLNGKVERVDMSMNMRNQAFSALVIFDNPNTSINCGVTADIEVSIYNNPNSLTVERKNIIREEEKNYVYVEDNGVARKREVLLGREDGLAVEVIKGLKEGERLIIEGQMLLEDGGKVKITNS